MAENEPQAKPREPRASATAEEASAEEVEVDERYVGVDPIYAQSAYEEPLEPEAGKGRSEEAKEEQAAVEAETEMIERVKANEAGNKVEQAEPVPFEEWLPESGVAARHQSVRGVDEEQAEADREATEAAKGDDGKIPPRSTSAYQPGVKAAP